MLRQDGEISKYWSDNLKGVDMIGKKKVETEGQIIIVPNGNLKLSNGKGSLELIDWKGEPAVLIDGAYILKHSLLATKVVQAISKGKDNG